MTKHTSCNHTTGKATVHSVNLLLEDAHKLAKVEGSHVAGLFKDQELCDLTTLGELLDSWSNQLIIHSPPNTLKATNYDLRIYQKACAFNSLHPFLIDPNGFVKIINSLATTYKPASIARIISSISKLFEYLNFLNPTRDEIVRSRLLEISKKDTSKKKVVPLNRDMLNTLISKWGHSGKLEDLRDLLIITLLFEVMLQRAEIINISVSDIYTDTNGFSLLVPQHAAPELKLTALKYDTGVLIQKWLHAADIETGYLIRGFKSNGKVREGQANVSLINKVTSRASKQLGLSTPLSGQSGRVGAIQTLAKSGLSAEAISHKARFKSNRMVKHYIDFLER